MSRSPRPSRLTLPCDARSVPRAREFVRTALTECDATEFIDSAELAVSELVTNAVVHAGTEVDVYVGAATTGVHVEIVDGNPHEPSLRAFAPMAGTGRGLRLLEQSVDRWGVIPSPSGKTVWFELGSPEPLPSGNPSAHGTRTDAAEGVGSVSVVLRNMPLLMHWAWQEHAAALLREYLLYALEDDPQVLAQHAEASDALSVLTAQVPVPTLPEDPDELLADSVEPGVSAPEVVLDIPSGSVPHFAALDQLLCRAIDAAHAGHLLGPPTQPEIGEMRRWVCEQVASQAEDGRLGAQAWAPHTDVRATQADLAELRRVYADLGRSDEALVAADEASVIVAVTAPALDLLGYADEDDLLGRRLIRVIPSRYHQAHIAGTTLHATNGRRQLLEVPITVPVLRADGSERLVRMRVSSEVAGDGRRVFVARFVTSAA